jgi:hypothetical protein
LFREVVYPTAQQTFFLTPTLEAALAKYECTGTIGKVARLGEAQKPGSTRVID